MGESITVSLLGHKDHGKSTLIGRLLYETKSVTEERVAEVRNMSKRLGLEMEYAFLLDSFQEEREGGFTLDTTRALVKHRDAIYELIDVPGHKELVKNMLSGTSNAEAAILVVSLKQGEGLQEETRLHASLGKFLGIDHLIVAVNKMDTIGYDEGKFNAFAEEMNQLLGRVGFREGFPVIPVSAREGDNIVAQSPKMPWFKGKPLFEEISERFRRVGKRLDERPLRLPVQDVYEDTLVGRIEAGVLKKGDEVVFQPSGRRARIARIRVYGTELDEARAGQNIGCEVEGVENADDLREQVCCAPGAEAAATDALQVEVFGLRDVPAGKPLLFKCLGGEALCTLSEFRDAVDLRVMERTGGEGIRRYESACARAKLDRPLVVENMREMPVFGRFILIDAETVAGVGRVIKAGAGVHGTGTSRRSGHRGLT